MLSIIICSRKQTVNENLLINIKNTIGCIYELIIIDNSENTYSIFEAYNLGIYKSSGEYLCFIHDDILFHTQDWGITINKIFGSDHKIGLIGIAGAKIKTKMPSAWWDCPEDQKIINIIQHLENYEVEKCEIGWNKNKNEEVSVIDGVFMVGRRCNNIKFYEKALKGFHNYDLNLSLEYQRHEYKIIVTKEIVIEHFSSGIINDEWIESTHKIHNIYKNILPLKGTNNIVRKETEVINAIRFIKKSLKTEKYNIALSVWWKLFLLYPNSNYHVEFWKTIVCRNKC